MAKGTKCVLVFQGGKNEAADESGHADDFEPDVHFTPVIPLPDLVDVTTGEEEEEILFSHRAKLYRCVGPVARPVFAQQPNSAPERTAATVITTNLQQISS